MATVATMENSKLARVGASIFTSPEDCADATVATNSRRGCCEIISWSSTAAALQTAALCGEEMSTLSALLLAKHSCLLAVCRSTHFVNADAGYDTPATLFDFLR